MSALPKSQEFGGGKLGKFRVLLPEEGRIGAGLMGYMMVLYYLSSNCLFFKKYEENQTWKDNDPPKFRTLGLVGI